MRALRWRAAGYILAGWAVAVLMLEGAVRWLDPNLLDNVAPRGLLVMDATLGWRIQPNLTVSHRTRDFDVSYSTNALGARDRPRSPSKDVSHTRVLLDGDSQVFGWGVPEAARFSNLIEDHGSGVEVWNLGVPGYGLDQQVLAYEHEGRDWNADAVIFFVSRQVLTRIGSRFAYQKFKPRFVIDQRRALQIEAIPPGATRMMAVLYRLLSPWRLPYFVERRFARLRASWRARGQGPDPLDAAPTGELVRALIDRAWHDARERGHRMALILAPGLPVSIRESLNAFGEPRHVEVVTLSLPDDSPAETWFSDGTHWNLEAHHWMADHLWRQRMFSSRAQGAAP